jgi:hypothetical protein
LLSDGLLGTIRPWIPRLYCTDLKIPKVKVPTTVAGTRSVLHVLVVVVIIWDM